VTDATNVEAAGAVMDGDVGSQVQAYDADLTDLADGTLSKSKVEDSANWDTAYGWGDHSTSNYLTSYTENDPVWAGVSNQYLKSVLAATTYVAVSGDTMSGDLNMGGNSITNIATNSLAFTDGETISSEKVRNWNTAHGWGNHATVGYLTGESDPIFDASAASGIAAGDITDWDEAHGWGNHATVGYLTGENDPIFGASVAADISGSATQNWDAAYGWGDHSTNGYVTSSTETDPVWAGVSNQYLKSASAASTYVATSGDTMTGRLMLPANGLVVGTTQLVVTNGYVGIGTSNPTNALAVNGTIKAREVIVTTNGWADFVFEPDYELMSLGEVESFIEANGHLPDVPTAEDVARGGVRMGEMQATLLRKIEELTLHVIELKKENNDLRARISGRGRIWGDEDGE